MTTMRKFLAAWLALTLAAAPARAVDLSITAANVKIKDNASTVPRVQYGETVAQGQPVYKKAADGKYWKADADLSAEAATATAIAITPGVANEYGFVITAGLMDLGATLTVGEIYVLSGAAGAVCPEADLSTGERVVILGVATATTTLKVNIFASGAVIP